MFKDEIRSKIKDMLDKSILERGLIILEDKLAPIKHLLEQRQIPDDPWTDDQIRWLFEFLASMDTDKDQNAARVGEREARVASDYILSLAEGFAHGIGRSGNISAIQPKAPGGSILNLLSSRIAKSLLNKIGLPGIKSAMVVPIATGMSLALCFSAIHQAGMDKMSGARWAKYEVLMPRLDHKSPLKGIKLAGFVPVQVPAHLDGDSVVVDVEDLKNQVNNKTAAIMSTTAFFPPRAPDNIKEIAKLCADLDLPHVINNSYGIQNEFYLKRLRGAMDAGRIDYIVQSTDKNFLTPVGGAVIASSSKDNIKNASETYAGRASAQPLVQFMAATLRMGLSGYKSLMNSQVENYMFLKTQMEEFASKIGQRLLAVENPIAIAMTLKGIPKKIGGMLYNLRVTGPRVVLPGDYGSCMDNYPVPYITLNAGIGARRKDFKMLIEKLHRVFDQL